MQYNNQTRRACTACHTPAAHIGVTTLYIYMVIGNITWMLFSVELHWASRSTTLIVIHTAVVHRPPGARFFQRCSWALRVGASNTPVNPRSGGVGQPGTAYTQQQSRGASARASIRREASGRAHGGARPQGHGTMWRSRNALTTVRNGKRQAKYLLSAPKPRSMAPLPLGRGAPP